MKLFRLSNDILTIKDVKQKSSFFRIRSLDYLMEGCTPQTDHTGERIRVSNMVPHSHHTTQHTSHVNCGAQPHAPHTNNNQKPTQTKKPNKPQPKSVAYKPTTPTQTKKRPQAVYLQKKFIPTSNKLKSKANPTCQPILIPSTPT